MSPPFTTTPPHPTTTNEPLQLIGGLPCFHHNPPHSMTTTTPLPFTTPLPCPMTTNKHRTQYCHSDCSSDNSLILNFKISQQPQPHIFSFKSCSKYVFALAH